MREREIEGEKYREIYVGHGPQSVWVQAAYRKAQTCRQEDGQMTMSGLSKVSAVCSSQISEEKSVPRQAQRRLKLPCDECTVPLVSHTFPKPCLLIYFTSSHPSIFPCPFNLLFCLDPCLQVVSFLLPLPAPSLFTCRGRVDGDALGGWIQ